MRRPELPEMSVVPMISWLRRMSGRGLRSGRLSGLRSMVARISVGDDCSPSRWKDEPVKSTQPSARPGGELTVASIAKWLEEMAKVESSIAEANRCVGQQIASIQAAIIFAQDNLSENDEVGQQALKKKIDCAEQFHQKVCQFNKVVFEVMRVAALMPQLARIIDGARRQNQGYAIAPLVLVGLAPVDPSRRRTWITKQLTRVEDELEQLEQLNRSANNVPDRPIATCLACLEAVVRLLTLQIDEIVSELGRLVAVIDELDRFIVAA